MKGMTLCAVVWLTACSGATVAPESPHTLRDAATAGPLAEMAARPSLTLAEAATLTLARNLELRAADQERLLALGRLDQAKAALWPDVGMHASAIHRDAEDRTTSVNNGLDRRMTSLEAGWSVLELGGAWLRVQQARREADLTALARSRAVDLLVLELWTAWLQDSAQRDLAADLSALLPALSAADELTERVQQAALVDPLTALAVRGRVQQARDNLRERRRVGQQAASRLQTLLAAPQATGAAVVDPALVPDNLAPWLEGPVEPWQDAALSRRSDLAGFRLQQQNVRDDIRQAWLGMTPSWRISVSRHHDTLASLLNPDWRENGYQAAWSALNVWSSWLHVKQGRVMAEQLQLRRLALAWSILEEVTVSRLRLAQAADGLQSARLQLAMAAQAAAVRRQRAPFAAFDEAETAEAEAAWLLARTRVADADTELTRAWGQWLVTLGAPLAPPDWSPARPDAPERLASYWQTLPQLTLAALGVKP